MPPSSKMPRHAGPFYPDHDLNLSLMVTNYIPRHLRCGRAGDPVGTGGSPLPPASLRVATRVEVYLFSGPPDPDEP